MRFATTATGRKFEQRDRRAVETAQFGRFICHWLGSRSGLDWTVVVTFLDSPWAAGAASVRLLGAVAAFPGNPWAALVTFLGSPRAAPGQPLGSLGSLWAAPGSCGGPPGQPGRPLGRSWQLWQLSRAAPGQPGRPQGSLWGSSRAVPRWLLAAVAAFRGSP